MKRKNCKKRKSDIKSGHKPRENSYLWQTLDAATHITSRIDCRNGD